MMRLGSILERAVNKDSPAKIRLSAAYGSIEESHGMFVQRSLDRLTQLQNAGIKSKQPALLQLADSNEFLLTLSACILGDIIPVPLGVPQIYSMELQSARRLRHTCASLQDPIILTGTDQFEPVKAFVHSNVLKEPPVIDVHALPRSTHEAIIGHPASDDTALMMLTSGSTGIPKIVQLSHRNVLAGINGSIQVNGYRPGDISLNWLPLVHVGALMRFLRDFHLGADIIQVPNADVLKNPLKWLDLVDEHRVNLTWAPNFAFRLVIDALDSASPTPTWDLHCLRSLHTSGEPIAAETVLRFTDLLELHGLNPAAMHTAWGMTEACFATCSHTYLMDLRKNPDSTPRVGRAVPGLEMRIVDGDDEEVASGQTGKLQIRGDLPTIGYHGDAGLNAEAFTHDGWLRTGDLASIRDGFLTILGRESNVIIVNGVNYSAAEIEATVESVHGVLPTQVAACAVQDAGGTDPQLAIFFSASSETNPGELKQRIRSSLARQLGLSPTHLIALPPDQIPRTESGKLQRSLLRDRFSTGIFEQVPPGLTKTDQNTATDDDRTPEIETLRSVFSTVLNRRGLRSHDDFFAHGGNSLKVLEAVSAIQGVFPGAQIGTTDIFRFPTARLLGNHLVGPVNIGEDTARGFRRAAQRRAAFKNRQQPRNSPRNES